MIESAIAATVGPEVRLVPVARSHSRMDIPASDLTPRAAGVVAFAATPLDRNPAAVYLARLAPGSRPTMRHALDVIASILTAGQADAFACDWSLVRYQHAQAVRTVLAERYRPVTANKTLSALRGVLREAWRLGLTSAEDYQRAADLEGVSGTSLPAGRALSAGELRALLDACAGDESPAGARDAALLAILYAAGLRRSEAVGLDIADMDTTTGALTVRRGKGNKDRIVYATGGAADALADWLVVRGDAEGPLFVPVNKGGRVADHRLTGQAVLGILQRRARQAGVTHVRPHDLRRTFVGDLLDAGADISTVQRLAGHATVETTARYDRRGEATKAKAASLLHVPYVRRTVALTGGPGERL
jgi:site-specific recombinase XerD